MEHLMSIKGWSQRMHPRLQTLPPLGPREAASITGVQHRKVFDSNSCTSAPTDSPVVRWVISRLEHWQNHLDHLPMVGTTSQRIQNTATALLQLEEEVKLIRNNLLNHTAETEHDGISFADDCGLNDTRVVEQYVITHVSSNTSLFSFEQLCYYMKKLPAWNQGSVLHDGIIFWHYGHDDEGFFTEKPDACAILPHSDISGLKCPEAYEFAISVNLAEGETIFRVQTVLVRQSGLI